ncbi:hypothetical protein NLJ89_g8887 [Agrocybe chaxingu]|uniref:Transaldolase n=1 Tax=Agrocybe chaxingu TaxID=84603 RepID=A0A9W8MU28_9AGAR|nr:hypothetical protein NLJ89_g8887 [Agrocybe chaxingu]
MPLPTKLLARATIPLDGGLERKLKDNNTAIIADTLHFETLSMHDLSGSMLNPGTLFQEIITGHLDSYVWVATQKTLDAFLEENGTEMRQEHVTLALEHLFGPFVCAAYQFTELACAIGDHVQGPHIAFVDPRVHRDTASLVASAKRLRKMLIRKGIPKKSIVVSIPATDAGLLAAQTLQKQRVHVNLYLVSCLIHAAACVEADATTISIPVGPLLKWYERRFPTLSRTMDEHPGVEAIHAILSYFKVNKIRTKVLGTDFRSLTEIGLVSECDGVCISAQQADKLRWSKAPIFPLEGKDIPAVLRARQAKYPTELLSKVDGFSKRLSTESRILTTKFLQESLRDLGEAMDTIELLVCDELEVKLKRYIDYEIVDRWSIGPEEVRREWLRPTKDKPKESSRKSVDIPPKRSQTPKTLMDEVF